MSQNFEYTQEIILDVDPNSAYPVINAKQNDVDSRVLVVQLIKNNEKYSIPTGNVIWLRYCKPDKHTGEIQGVVNSNGTVSITLTKQCLAVAGRVYADLVEFDGVNTTGKVLSTASFIINVQASPDSMSNPDTFSSDEFLALKQFVDHGLDIITTGIPYNQAVELIDGMDEDVKSVKRNLVLLQDTQPVSNDNRIWITETGNEIVVPSYEEFTELQDTVNGLTSTGSGGNANFWFGTRAEYNAISQKNPDICYCIEEGT